MNKANYINGIPLEQDVTRFFEQNGCGSGLDHNNFDPTKYPFDNHNVVDIVKKDSVLAECTNPKETTWMNDPIMINKIEYFQRKDPFHRLMWILIVSFANFSDHIKNLIDRYGIILIVLNHRATQTNRKTFINRLYHSKLYQITKKLSVKKSPFFISNSTSIRTIPQYCCTEYTDYLHTTDYSTNTNYLHTNTNYLHQHTDPNTNSTDTIERTIENFDYTIIESMLIEHKDDKRTT